jgi:hypothetical protein
MIAAIGRPCLKGRDARYELIRNRFWPVRTQAQQNRRERESSKKVKYWNRVRNASTKIDVGNFLLGKGRVCGACNNSL